MNRFLGFVQEQKLFIDKNIISFLDEEKEKYALTGMFSSDVFNDLKNFCVSGKSIRGSLVLLSGSFFGHNNKQQLLDLASGLEILHSSFLIHDDIMDNDTLRRGELSLFAQYTEYTRNKRVKDPNFLAKSLATCVGDIGFFLGLNIINRIGKHKVSGKIISEIIKVGFAQMDDVYFGSLNALSEIEKIKNVYLYKTARYTFSLPLSLGAIISGQSDIVIKRLEELGENQGMIYQITDDWIGIFSDNQTSGKPVGSDIRENKKTLIKAFLYQKSTDCEKNKLDKIFGNNDLNTKDINYVKEKIMEKGIDIKIDALIKKYSIKAKELISDLSVSQNHQMILKDLLDFIKTRKK